MLEHVVNQLSVRLSLNKTCEISVFII